MKPYVYMFAILACAVTSANCIVCPPNPCATVLCQNVIQSDCECNDGIYDANGGYCGCCPVCLKKLREGDNCALLLLRGTPPTAACEEGTSCQRSTNSADNSNTFVCQSDKPKSKICRTS